MTLEIQLLKRLYIDHLKDMYSAECQIARALPQIIDRASMPQLKSALQNHLTETVKHVERLERLFGSLESSPFGQKCVGIEGILRACKVATVAEIASPEFRDVVLIAACQNMEHFEISTYGTARVYASSLGENEAAGLLIKTLEEEKSADDELTAIGLNIIYHGAPSLSTARNRETPELPFVKALYASFSRRKEAATAIAQTKIHPAGKGS